MQRLLQIIASILVFGVLPVLGAAYYSEGAFLDKFLSEQSLGLIGTMLAIYIAAASSFVAILMSFEEKNGKKVFQKTSKELKENIIFIFIVFFVHFMLLAATPDSFAKEDVALQWILRGTKVFTFLLFIFALYELSRQLFTIRDKLPKTNNPENNQ